jgi:hypothetical protein
VILNVIHYRENPLVSIKLFCFKALTLSNDKIPEALGRIPEDQFFAIFDTALVGFAVAFLTLTNHCPFRAILGSRNMTSLWNIVDAPNVHILL